jgi:RES domain-containing protein
MSARRSGHDVALLDALGELPETSFDGEFWRIVHGIRSPLDGSKGAGRWNRRESEVLYCALERDGALSEIDFHLRRAQPIFPSRLVSVAYQMRASFEKVVDLTDMTLLAKLGVATSRYREILYEETQKIGEAVGFLGFHAMIVPNARHPSVNVVVFPANCDLDVIENLRKEPVNWAGWQRDRTRIVS